MILVALIQKDFERSNSKYYHNEQCQYYTNHGWELQYEKSRLVLQIVKLSCRSSLVVEIGKIAYKRVYSHNWYKLTHEYVDLVQLSADIQPNRVIEHNPR